MDTDPKELAAEEQHMRRVAFVAVVVSTVAVAVAVVSLPLIYTRVQNLQTHIYNKVDECRVRLLKSVYFD